MIESQPSHITLLFLLTFPVKARIMFKVFITFKTLHGLSTAYISSLLQVYHPPNFAFINQITSRYSYSEFPEIWCMQLAFSFLIHIPTLWNTFNDSIENTISVSSFKVTLLAFLFREFFQL